MGTIFLGSTFCLCSTTSHEDLVAGPVGGGTLGATDAWTDGGPTGAGEAGWAGAGAGAGAGVWGAGSDG